MRGHAFQSGYLVLINRLSTLVMVSCQKVLISRSFVKIRVLNLLVPQYLLSGIWVIRGEIKFSFGMNSFNILWSCYLLILCMLISASKRIMGAAGVPLVPGYHGHEQDIDFMKSEADKIGYPILIKPTHGGGGKVCHIFVVI